MYLKSVPSLFFRPPDREEYLSILFGIDAALTDAHSIALEREVLINALKRQVRWSLPGWIWMSPTEKIMMLQQTRIF